MSARRNDRGHEMAAMAPLLGELQAAVWDAQRAHTYRKLVKALHVVRYRIEEAERRVGEEPRRAA